MGQECDYSAWSNDDWSTDPSSSPNCGKLTPISSSAIKVTLNNVLPLYDVASEGDGKYPYRELTENSWTQDTGYNTQTVYQPQFQLLRRVDPEKKEKKTKKSNESGNGKKDKKEKKEKESKEKKEKIKSHERPMKEKSELKPKIDFQVQLAEDLKVREEKYRLARQRIMNNMTFEDDNQKSKAPSRSIQDKRHIMKDEAPRSNSNHGGNDKARHGSTTRRYQRQSLSSSPTLPSLSSVTSRNMDSSRRGNSPRNPPGATHNNQSDKADNNDFTKLSSSAT
ncbi:hypothetical protein NADFUDRAFT_80893, partial [Nadsonia fulvescens var. elongata DSM 6958]